MQRLALILEVSTAETVGTQAIDLQHLHLIFVRHCFELGTNVERVFFCLADYTTAVDFRVDGERGHSAMWPPG